MGQQNVILVFGATGTIGREVVKNLCQEHSKNNLRIKAAYHSEEKARDLKNFGDVELVYVDFENKESIRNALHGVTTLYLLTGYTVDMLVHSWAVISEAQKAGVLHIVHNGVMQSPNSLASYAVWHFMIEKTIERSGLNYTFIRPAIYMDNLLGYGNWEPEPGTVTWFCNQDVPLIWISSADLGAFGAAILANPGAHRNKEYKIGTGTMTMRQIVEKANQTTGLNLQFKKVSPDEMMDIMVNKLGNEPEYMKGTALLFKQADEGNGAVQEMTEDVSLFKSVTGRNPEDWSQFLLRNSDKLRSLQTKSTFTDRLKQTMGLNNNSSLSQSTKPAAMQSMPARPGLSSFGKS